MEKEQRVLQSNLAKTQLSFTKSVRPAKTAKDFEIVPYLQKLISTPKSRLNLILITSLIAGFPMIQCTAETLNHKMYDFEGQSAITSIILILVATFAAYLSKKDDDRLFLHANIAAIGYYLIVIAGKIFPNFTESSYLWMLLVANLVGPATAFLVIFNIAALLVRKEQASKAAS